MNEGDEVSRLRGARVCLVDLRAGTGRLRCQRQRRTGSYRFRVFRRYEIEATGVYNVLLALSRKLQCHFVDETPRPWPVSKVGVRFLGLQLFIRADKFLKL